MSQRNTRRTPARILTAALTLSAALMLAACSTADSDLPTIAVPGTAAADAAMEELGLGGLDARQIIDELDATPLTDRSTAFTASIRPDELVITTADQTQVSLPMPDDAFYVSFAPYESSNHDCYYHSLTTCTGEMQGADVHMTVTDDSTGEVLVDETRTTFDNGFVGVWLPRDIDATVTIEHEGKSATQDVSTRNSDDATCVTTMQLT
ncbi:CueP family metal-binding protein [Demequina capsici]|uniref:CueP family metal-binding protein n=1 Tax=Demequina capsici TaxID=3075620 RepID=A0AA96F8Z4_9MICO|nr:CueP family metal-binding protein [Demequina sp. OYTSA14]WNM24865.1 CueP family metal-binding protein [Demequina sp. OYTSA14]